MYEIPRTWGIDKKEDQDEKSRSHQHSGSKRKEAIIGTCLTLPVHENKLWSRSPASRWNC